MACENCGGCKCKTTVKDNDGHRYEIPAKREAEFKSALEATTKHPQGSAGWHDAHDALHAGFGKYLAG